MSNNNSKKTRSVAERSYLRSNFYTCPECKKKFLCNNKSEWVYKNEKGQPLCSYTCQRKPILAAQKK